MPHTPTLLSDCPALVLAGGLGKRLREAYDAGPKVLAPVAGRRFLEYLLLWLHDSGIRRVILCIGYKGTQLERWLGKGREYGLDVRYSSEATPLGTAGAIKHAENLVHGDSFFALNGDSFLDVDLREMCRYHSSHSGVGTLAITSQSGSARYGNVEMNRKGEIIRFAEKGPSGAANESSSSVSLINGGVYLLRKTFFDLIPRGRPVSIEQEVFPQLTDGRLHGFITNSYFVDIGIPADYERAQTELPEKLQYDHTGKSPFTG